MPDESPANEAELAEELAADLNPPAIALTPIDEVAEPVVVHHKPGMARRVAGGTLHYGVGQALPQVIRFLLMPVFTRFLTPSEYAVMGLAGTVGEFLVIWMRFGVPGAVNRFYFEHREGPSLRDYVTTIAWFLVVSSSVTACIALAVWPWAVQRYMPPLTLYPFGVLVVLSAMIACAQNLQDRLVQSREQAAYAARLNIGRAIISITLALVLVVGLQQGVAGMLLAELVAAALIGIQSLRYLSRELTGRFRWPMLKSSLAYAAGIFPSHFAGNLGPLITKPYLANVDSLSGLGVLESATKFAQPLRVLASAFQSAYNPVYFSVREEKTSEGLERLAVTSRNVWLAAVYCALLAALFGPPAIVLMLPPSYHAAAALVPVLTIGFLGQAMYTLLGPEMFYSKKTFLVPVVSFTSIAVTVVLTILTAREYGAMGMAWAISAGSITTALVAGAFARHLVKIRHDWGSFLRVSFCGALVAAVGMSLPAETVVAQLAVALVGAVAFPLALWALREPGLHDALSLARRTTSRSK